MRSEGRGSRLATAGLALARPALATAPSARRAVEWRSTAAKMSVRKNANAWCRALGTGRARWRADGREARRRSEAPEPGGPGVWVVPCSKARATWEVAADGCFSCWKGAKLAA